MTIDDFLRKVVGVTDTTAIIAPRGLIDTWLAWYRGFVPDVHTMRVGSGNGVKTVKAKTLEVAQKVCEDWGGFIVNEKTNIQAKGDTVSKLLIGDDNNGNRGVLGNNNFWARVASSIEVGFATGTVAAVVRTDEKGRIKIDFATYESFYPVSWVDDQITECVFITKRRVGGIELTYFTAHMLNPEGKYEVKSWSYDKENREVDTMVFYTNSDIPLFSFFSPNKGNNTQYGGMPYGVSILSGRTGILTAIDALFNMALGDIEMGGIRILLSKSLFVEDRDGDGDVTPFDLGVRQLLNWMEHEGNEKPLVKDFNPSLQLGVQFEAMDKLLSMLGHQVGLGSEKYTYTAGALTTATAIKMSSADQTRGISNHRLKAEAFMEGIVNAIIMLNGLKDGVSLNQGDLDDNPDEYAVNFSYDDSIFEDKAERMRMDMDMVQRGLMIKRVFVIKYGLTTEENADAYLAELKEDAPIYSSYQGG